MSKFVAPAVVTSSVIREWAQSEGHEVGARGHLPLTIIAEFVRTFPEVAYSDGPAARTSEKLVTITPCESVDAGSVMVWAVLSGMADEVAASRGRVTPELADAFNAAHDDEKFYSVPTVEITGEDGASKVATVAEVRAWAAENGYTLPAKGRTPHNVYADFLAV